MIRHLYRVFQTPYLVQANVTVKEIDNNTVTDRVLFTYQDTRMVYARNKQQATHKYEQLITSACAKPHAHLRKHDQWHELKDIRVVEPVV